MSKIQKFIATILKKKKAKEEKLVAQTWKASTINHA